MQTLKLMNYLYRCQNNASIDKRYFRQVTISSSQTKSLRKYSDNKSSPYKQVKRQRKLTSQRSKPPEQTLTNLAQNKYIEYLTKKRNEYTRRAEKITLTFAADSPSRLKRQSTLLSYNQSAVDFNPMLALTNKRVSVLPIGTREK